MNWHQTNVKSRIWSWFKSGINNLLCVYSVSKCVYLYENTFQTIWECCPNADIAFLDVSYIAENGYTGEDVSFDINPKISRLNAALGSLCTKYNKSHFIDLRQYLSSNGLNTIDRCNLCYDGLNYSKRGDYAVGHVWFQRWRQWNKLGRKNRIQLVNQVQTGCIFLPAT